MLRVSVTDVCNLRCVYCMPAEGVTWLPRSSLLTFEEIARVVRAAAAAGISHVKLTGGEPTARRDLPVLVQMLRGIPGVQDLSLTTNGMVSAEVLEKLQAAGLDRLTISLCSLRSQRFAAMTRGGDLRQVQAALDQALALRFRRVKINAVVMKHFNEDEVADFAALTRRLPITVRFIEFMPLGRRGVADDSAASLVTQFEIRRAIEAAHGPLVAVRRDAEAGLGPAGVWTLPDAAGRLGFISAMSHPFCGMCNRLRLTPDGRLRACLFDGGEVDLKPILRPESSCGSSQSEGGIRKTEEVDAAGNLQGVQTRLLKALRACVAMKPEVHCGHGNQAMNRIGG